MANRPVRFVLLSTQRSGTSWLMERLAAHPEVGGYGELFLEVLPGQDGLRPDWPEGANDRPWFQPWLEQRGVRAEGWRRYRLLSEYLDYIYEPRRGLRAIGFKLMYDELRPLPEMLLYLRSRKVRVLHLLRWNLLDIVVSRAAMEQRTYAHARSEAEREAVKVHIDTMRLIPQLKRLERERWVARRLVRLLGLRSQEFIYEDMVAHDERLLDVLRFLGVEAGSTQGLDPVMLKLAPDSQRATIENYDEIAERFDRPEWLRP